MNLEQIKGTEIRGYSMDSGIFVITLVSEYFGQRTIIISDDCALGEAFLEISKIFSFELDTTFNFLKKMEK